MNDLAGFILAITSLGGGIYIGASVAGWVSEYLEDKIGDGLNFIINRAVFFIVWIASYFTLINILFSIFEVS